MGYSHTVILFRITTNKDISFLLRLSAEQDNSCPASFRLGNKVYLYKLSSFQSSQKHPSNKGQSYFNWCLQGILIEMQTPRGDAAESLIVEQLSAGFNTSCG